MSDPRCANHPVGCWNIAVQQVIALIVIGCTFGWRWTALIVALGCELDAAIRLWKHKCAH